MNAAVCLALLVGLGPVHSAQPATSHRPVFTVLPNFPVGAGEQEYIVEIRRLIRLGAGGMASSIKWSDVETIPGNFLLKSVQDQAGVAALLGGASATTLQTIDTNNKTIPGDLAAEPWNSQRMKDRLERFIKEVTPKLGPNTKWLSLGNEVDIYLGEHKAEAEAFAELMEHGFKVVKGIRPDLKVGVTVSSEGLHRVPDMVRRLNRSTDVMFVTYYHMTPEMLVQPIAKVKDRIDAIFDFLPGKPVVLQEVGIPASPTNGSSEAMQADFVREVFAQLDRRADRLELASYFLMVDFSSDLVDLLTKYYRLDHPRFVSYLATLGLRDQFGKPRPAYFVFREEMMKRAKDDF